MRTFIRRIALSILYLFVCCGCAQAESITKQQAFALANNSPQMHLCAQGNQSACSEVQTLLMEHGWCAIPNSTDITPCPHSDQYGTNAKPQLAYPSGPYQEYQAECAGTRPSQYGTQLACQLAHDYLQSMLQHGWVIRDNKVWVHSGYVEASSAQWKAHLAQLDAQKMQALQKFLTTSNNPYAVEYRARMKDAADYAEMQSKMPGQ
jgi:hypothetical protein